MMPRGVEVRRHLHASAERVFAAFADGTTVGRWLRPSPDVELTVLALDFRVGGAYRFEYRVPDGQVMTVGGIYRAIERPRRLVFTWLIEPPDVHAGIESLVTVNITPQAGGAQLVICHDRFDRADANERHEQGWLGALLGLSALLAETEQE